MMFAVERPWITIDCIGNIKDSPVMESVAKNPNFENPWAKFDLVSYFYLYICLSIIHISMYEIV